MKLIKHCDERTLRVINDFENRAKENFEKSSATTSSISVPAPNDLKYYNYQLAGVEYIATHRNVLLADEMGLGKTIEIAGYINYKHPNSILIIVPKSLLINWEYELKKWLVYNYRIIILNSKNIDEIKNISNTIFITNYEKAEKLQTFIFNHKLNIIFDMLVLDESQYIKNYKAKRTRAITGYYLNIDGINKTWIPGLSSFAKKKILVTGTPLINNLGELYTQLKVIDSELANQSPIKFIGKYTNNLTELQKLLRQEYMIRREKKDVLELPEKIRQLMIFPENTMSDTTSQENKEMLLVLKNISSESLTYDDILKSLYSSPPLFERISKLRHLIALDKLPLLFDFIDNIIDSGQKIVVFAHHHDIIESIYQYYKNISVYIDSDIDTEERDKRVMLFNNDENIKMFIGSLRTTSFGINLTSANIVVFAELDWTAAIMHQAEDRCHRIGQTSKLTVYIPIVERSIEEFIASKIYQKEYMSINLLNKEAIL